MTVPNSITARLKRLEQHTPPADRDTSAIMERLMADPEQFNIALAIAERAMELIQQGKQISDDEIAAIIKGVPHEEHHNEA